MGCWHGASFLSNNSPRALTAYFEKQVVVQISMQIFWIILLFADIALPVLPFANECAKHRHFRSHNHEVLEKIKI